MGPSPPPTLPPSAFITYVFHHLRYLVPLALMGLPAVLGAFIPHHASWRRRAQGEIEVARQHARDMSDGVELILSAHARDLARLVKERDEWKERCGELQSKLDRISPQEDMEVEGDTTFGSCPTCGHGQGHSRRHSAEHILLDQPLDPEELLNYSDYLDRADQPDYTSSEDYDMFPEAHTHSGNEDPDYGVDVMEYSSVHGDVDVDADTDEDEDGNENEDEVDELADGMRALSSSWSGFSLHRVLSAPEGTQGKILERPSTPTSPIPSGDYPHPMAQPTEKKRPAALDLSPPQHTSLRRTPSSPTLMNLPSSPQDMVKDFRRISDTLDHAEYQALEVAKAIQDLRRATSTTSTVHSRRSIGVFPPEKVAEGGSIVEDGDKIVKIARRATLTLPTQTTYLGRSGASSSDSPTP